MLAPIFGLTLCVASSRTRSSGRSWGSITRRHRGGHDTPTQSSLSLSPIPSLHALPTNDFGSPLDKGIFEKTVFERVEEEDESQAGGSSEANIQAGRSSNVDKQKAIKVMVSTDMDITVNSNAASTPPPPANNLPAVSRQPFFSRTTASKPISPSAISSGSWIANRLQEATATGTLSLSRPSNTPPRIHSPNSSSSSLAGRGKSVPPNSGVSQNATPSPLSSSPPVLNIAISPSTTPTSSTMNMRRVASSNALDSTVEMSEDQMATVRPRQAAPVSSQANRNVSVYKSHDSMSSSASEDPIALYRAYSQESLHSNLPYLNPTSSTPKATPNIRHPIAQHPPSRPPPSSPPTSGKLDLSNAATGATLEHSRHVSSSDTSGSDLDLSRYNFPDAPGNEPRVLPRETEPAPLHMIVESGSGESVVVRRPLGPVNRSVYQNQSAPPVRAASRAPVQPGAYQAALRSVMDDVPEGPPPLYQPRTSRRYHVDQSQDQEYPEPLTPTSYSPRPVASPSKAPVRSVLDTSAATLRPNPRSGAPASPLSEVYTPQDGSPVERYPSETRMNERSYSSEKSYSGLHRSGSGRRPSDPYQRLLAAAAKNSPPNTPPRRGSSTYSPQQTLSPHMAATHYSLGAEHPESPTESSGSDPRSRPPSQAFSTYTRGTRHSTWGASQSTVTAVDHHEADFPHMDEDDGTFYSAMFGDIDGYENERGRAYKEALIAKSMRFNGKERDWLHPNGPPLPQIPRHLLAARLPATPEPATSRSPSRQLPTPPIGPTATPPPGPAHPHFPGGMGWDELSRPVPRKLSKMEKALLRRVEFGAVAAADIASIPLA
jgi:hypothetical protein